MFGVPVFLEFYLKIALEKEETIGTVIETEMWKLGKTWKTAGVIDLVLGFGGWQRKLLFCPLL